MPRRAENPPTPRALTWTCRPHALIGAWPAETPLACVVSAGAHARWARWSILARPVDELDIGAGEDPLGAIDRSCAGGAPGARAPRDAGDPPFSGGWLGWLGYGLGAAIEPSARAPGAARARDDAPLRILRCPGAYVFDHVESRWWAVGDGSSLPRLEGGAPARARGASDDAGGFSTGELRSETGRAGYERAVRRVIELIGAGDVFQVNLAHRLACRFEGAPRALFLRLLGEMAPWYGACIEAPGAGETVLSMSPELFLDVDMASRRVVTRPIKGTRPARDGAGALERSEKDRAELVMIVDLMRNDLGRVCEVGSVVVEEERAIEHHGAAGERAGGVLHGVATVAGRLREGVTIGALLRATFPPGSVTGAPKIRAMQIIDELEPVARGPYCGAVGFISDCGRASFNVAIRTAVVRAEPAPGGPPGVVRGELRYSVGAGVVADSDPASEWAETMDKAAAFQRVVERAGAAGDSRTTPLAGARA